MFHALFNLKCPFKSMPLLPISNNKVRVEVSTILRTVPTIVIAHTFCASLDTRISLCDSKPCGESRI